MKKIFSNKLFFFLSFQFSIFNFQLNAQPGTLDKSFGNDGKSLGVGFGYASDMALQKDEKVLMIGSYGDGISIGRFLTNGKPDSSFGIYGNQRIKIHLGTGELNIALLNDEKIYSGWYFLRISW